MSTFREWYQTLDDVWPADNPVEWTGASFIWHTVTVEGSSAVRNVPAAYVRAANEASLYNSDCSVKDTKEKTDGRNSQKNDN